MDKIECTTAEREPLHSWRFHHPHPRVQLKMAALYLKSQGLAPEDISHLCALSKTTFYRYLHEYRTGGIEKLTEGPFHQRQTGPPLFPTSDPRVYRAGAQPVSAKVGKLVDPEVSNLQSSSGARGGIQRMPVSSGQKGTEKSFI